MTSTIPGPFIPDRNISVAMFSFEDRVWVILRRALHDADSASDFGVIAVSGVREHRTREIDETELAELIDQVEERFWAIDLGATDFLAQSLKSERHPVSDSSSYHHFLIPNGWDRVIEVVGKQATCHVLQNETSLTLKDLFSENLDRLIPIQ